MKLRLKRFMAILLCFMLIAVISPFMKSSDIVYAKYVFPVSDQAWSELKVALGLDDDRLTIFKIFFNKCIEEGWTPQATVGLLANVYGESGFDPLAGKDKNSDDVGIGLFQITGDDAVQGLSNYCNEHCGACKVEVDSPKYGHIYLCITGEHQIEHEFARYENDIKSNGTNVEYGRYTKYQYFAKNYKVGVPDTVDLDGIYHWTGRGHDDDIRFVIPEAPDIKSLDDYAQITDVLAAANAYNYLFEGSLATQYAYQVGEHIHKCEIGAESGLPNHVNERWNYVFQSGDYAGQFLRDWFIGFYYADINGIPQGNKLGGAYKIAKILGINSGGVIYDGIIDRSIIQSYAGNSLIYSQNVGWLLDHSDESEAKMIKKNQNVYKDYICDLKNNTDSCEKYSLFELFGEDLHWYRYTGEYTYRPALLDHIWSAWDQDKLNELYGDLGKVIKTIFYDGTNYLSCRVYYPRCDVLTKEDIANGYVDPRVSISETGLFNGYSYTLGTIKMTIAKYLSSCMAILIGPRLFQRIGDILEDIETSDFWDVFSNVAKFFMLFAAVAFIISLVGKAKKYSTGKGSGREAVHRFVIGAFCFGFIFLFLASPTTFNKVIIKAATGVDEFFQNLINEELQKKNDEVIAMSKDSAGELTTQAVIWDKAIFGPWCRGQFGGLEYNELYTTYVDPDDLEKGQFIYDQSHEEVDYDDETNKAFYNSAEYTGDVYVPVGNHERIRNWAAYLMSCGSKYHIDSTLGEYEGQNTDDLDENETPKYPCANTVATKSDLMADTFRVVDATMNIAPQEYADGTTIANYEGSRMPETSFSSQGTVMLLNTFLLIFFIPVIFSKFKNFILIIIIPMQMVYHSILELFKENSGMREYGKIFKNACISFFVASLRANIMLLLYYMFVDTGFFNSLLYCVLCIIVLGFNVRDLKKTANNIKVRTRRLRARKKLNHAPRA